MPMRRLFFDVSFTRTQGVNVGITRTVKRLCEEFTNHAPAHGMACVPVVFHTAGFRSLSRDGTAVAAGSPSSAPPPAASGIFHWISTGPIRHLVSTYFPLPLRRLAWLAYTWWDFNRLARDLPAIDIGPGDVLFLSDASWNYPVWTAARGARQRGAKVVTVVYDLIPVRQPQFCPRLTTIAFGKWLRRLMPCSDGVLCISKAVQEDLRRYAAETRIELPRTKNFRLGCDPVSASGDSTHIRQEIRDFLAEAPCFTAIGSIEPRKNYAFLLDAFERLWARGADARLLIIGRRTSQCSDLLERIDRHPERGARLRVVFDGTDEEVAFAYAGSRALLFPSLAEGFGLPLVEARARGCLVIASDLPAFAELADEGVALFPVGSLDAFEGQILLHLRNHWRAGRIIPFTWADSAKRCMAFFEDLALTEAAGADKGGR